MISPVWGWLASTETLPPFYILASTENKYKTLHHTASFSAPSAKQQRWQGAAHLIHLPPTDESAVWCQTPLYAPRRSTNQHLHHHSSTLPSLAWCKDCYSRTHIQILLFHSSFFPRFGQRGNKCLATAPSRPQRAFVSSDQPGSAAVSPRPITMAKLLLLLLPLAALTHAAHFRDCGKCFQVKLQVTRTNPRNVAADKRCCVVELTVMWFSPCLVF